MAITEYRTKQGRRYQAHLWTDQQKVASRAGFATKADARAWLASERNSRRSTMTGTAFGIVLEKYLDDAKQRRKRNT